jgi:hypothetical protein
MAEAMTYASLKKIAQELQILDHLCATEDRDKEEEYLIRSNVTARNHHELDVAQEFCWSRSREKAMKVSAESNNHGGTLFT